MIVRHGHTSDIKAAVVRGCFDATTIKLTGKNARLIHDEYCCPRATLFIRE